MMKMMMMKMKNKILFSTVHVETGTYTHIWQKQCGRLPEKTLALQDAATDTVVINVEICARFSSLATNAIELKL